MICNTEWNDYFICRKAIGKGAFSKVYYGINKTTSVEVAIKKISFGNLPDSIKKRSIQEIDILKNLSHQNIIRLYDYKFENNYLFLITEYCKDGDLGSWINRDNKSSHEILDIVRQIVEGLSYLHENQIIHRDIKPQNILIHNNVIKICDFGFSNKFKSTANMFQTLCGTPLYMCPEVIFMQPYTIKSEIWSLGILLYNIFFNSHPYGSLESIEMYRKKLKSPIPTIEINTFEDQFFNDIFTDLINKMLSPNPDTRPDISYILNEVYKCTQNNVEDIFSFDDISIESNSSSRGSIIKTPTSIKSTSIENYTALEKISNSFINSPPNENIESILEHINEVIIVDDYFSSPKEGSASLHELKMRPLTSHIAPISDPIPIFKNKIMSSDIITTSYDSFRKVYNIVSTSLGIR